MNRTIALFLALAVLLAHALALHKSVSGDLAPPYEIAHVAYRIGRNLVQTGQVAWDTPAMWSESYPSILWILVSAIAERLYMSVTFFCQVIGCLCALATVLVVAQFSPVRLVGVVAPILLVVSGGLASSALSGTEIPLLTLLVTASFMAYEARRPRMLSVLLLALCMTRAEGAMLVIAIACMELYRARRARKLASQGQSVDVDPNADRHTPVTAPAGNLGIWPFLPAYLAILVFACARYFATDTWLSPAMRNSLAPQTQNWWRGLQSLSDFFVSSAAPVLIIFPIWYLFRKQLDAVGKRALFLTAVWSAIYVNSSGGILPFNGEMVPILPVLFVSVQSAIRVSMDSDRKGLPALAWSLFLLGILSSALASKYPGDLGPLRTEALHRRWLRPRSHSHFGQGHGLARLGLDNEIKTTERLRAVGLFLRDELDLSARVLTPWPGAVGYLSRLEVHDVLCRTNQSDPSRTQLNPWKGYVRADLVEVLRQQPEYIIPSLVTTGVTPRDLDVAEIWVRELDSAEPTEERVKAVLSELQRYELLAVPLNYENRLPARDAATLFLLRDRQLNLAPQLTVAPQTDGTFKVEAAHQSHSQLVDLQVEFITSEGEVWSMRPTGDFTKKSMALARTGLLLSRTGGRPIHLATIEMPKKLRNVKGQLRIVLINPRSSSNTHSFALASKPVAIEL